MFFRVMGRLTIRFFAGIGRVIVGFFRSLVRHPVAWIFSLLLIGGVVGGWIYTGGYGIGSASNDNGVITAQASDQANGKSEEFLNDYSKLDANAMWNLMSEDFKQTQATKGVANAQDMQKLINAKVAELAKDGSKPKFKFLWNNGRANSDGSAFDVFSGEVSWPAAGDKVPRSIVYGVSTDKDGKVKSVLSQTSSGDVGDPVMAAAFPTEKTDKSANSGLGSANNKINPTTADFLSGLTNFDANKFWSTLSPAYQKELNDQKVTPETIQKVFDQVKKQAQDSKTKLGYVGFSLRENINYPNGTAVETYIADLQISTQVQRSQYLIMLDNTNKISAIGTDDPILSNALGRKQSAGN